MQIMPTLLVGVVRIAGVVMMVREVGVVRVVRMFEVVEVVRMGGLSGVVRMIREVRMVTLLAEHYFVQISVGQWSLLLDVLWVLRVSWVFGLTNNNKKNYESLGNR